MVNYFNKLKFLKYFMSRYVHVYLGKDIVSLHFSLSKATWIFKCKFIHSFKNTKYPGKLNTTLFAQYVPSVNQKVEKCSMIKQVPNSYAASRVRYLFNLWLLMWCREGYKTWLRSCLHKYVWIRLQLTWSPITNSN